MGATFCEYMLLFVAKADVLTDRVIFVREIFIKLFPSLLWTGGIFSSLLNVVCMPVCSNFSSRLTTSHGGPGLFGSELKTLSEDMWVLTVENASSCA